MNTRTKTPTAPMKRNHVLINRSFALTWCGQAISVVGDTLFNTTLVLWVAAMIAQGQQWAPLAVAGIFLTASIPTFVIGPVAGVFTDRWDKRRTMLWMDAIRAALITLLLLVNALPLKVDDHLSIFLRLGIIYGIVFLVSSCTQFFSPSLLALISRIVEKSDQVRASGLNQIPASLATVVGPSLAVLLFFTVGVQWAFLLNALSFIGSFLAILAIRAPQPVQDITPRQNTHFIGEFREGVRFYASNRLLVTILISGVLIILGDGAFNALNIFFVTQNLHTLASFYGLLGSIFGLGAIAGAAVASIVARWLGVIRTFWLSIMLSGIVTLLYTRLSNFSLALVVIFLLGGLITVVNVTVMPLVFLVTPSELIGRVASVLTPALSVAALLSLGIAGYLESTLLYGFHTTLFGITFGPVDTIFVGTGILTLISGLYAMVNLRSVTPAKEEIRKEV